MCGWHGAACSVCAPAAGAWSADRHAAIWRIYSWIYWTHFSQTCLHTPLCLRLQFHKPLEGALS